jgi:glutamyl-tRNA synthetase
MTEVRTRFAPSPTGHLHIGGARTALFSWLFARRHGGKFILRIEDTDQARSTQASAEALIRDLQWLGMDWDEGPALDGKGGSSGPHGPYYQSQRLGIYAKCLEQLKAKGLAYPSFDSKEEVEAEREAAIAEGRAPVQSGSAATAEEVAAKAAQGIQPAWRFAMPQDGVTEFQDLVHGKMRFENKLMADFVLVRSDGLPTYNFAATVDDALMGMTHVIRGDDHLSNSPRQVCLYRALGFAEPAFAHIPMILGPDKQRLSKRHGATAVGQYQELGFLPEALMNYLALLGWSLDDKTTLISIPELKAAFGLERCTKHAAVFDNVKLEWMNGQYLKQAGAARLASLLGPKVAAGLARPEKLEKLAGYCAEKARTLAEIPLEAEYLAAGLAIAPTAEALSRFFKAGKPGWLAAFAEASAGWDLDQPAQVEAAAKAWGAEQGLKFGDLAGVLRVALSGRTVTLIGFDKIMELLGQAEVQARLKAAQAWQPA